MKYDSQVTELKNLLPTAKNILICLPTGADIDRLAAGLALFLILEAAGKEVSIASDEAIKVSQSHLFGVDHVQKNIPQTEGGNLTLTLEGVAASDNTIPALEKLDWYAEGNNLNLVFHVLPGQTFQPAKITPHYQGSGFNLIFVVGAVNLNGLGALYQQNQQIFSGTHIVNIDSQTANTGYGQTNVLDTNVISVSEMMVNLISDLGYSLDGDSASNLLAGIFDATGNLSDPKVSAETYMAIANCLRVGGKKPQVMGRKFETQAIPTQDLSALIPQTPSFQPTIGPQINPQFPSVNTPQIQTQPVPEYIAPPVVPSQPAAPPQVMVDAGDDSQSSPEERPMDEGVVSETVEPEWLTPKIFKGSSLG